MLRIIGNDECHVYDTYTDIKFFPEYYVGLREEKDAWGWDPTTRSHAGSREYYLGFMTQYDNTAAFEKRKKTVEEWCRSYTNPPKPTRSLVVRNIRTPVRLGGLNRRYSTNNVVWRIQVEYSNTPFELEISSENLSYLFLTATINKGGELDRPCAWVRRLSSNLLIPEDSKVWQEKIAHNI